MRDLIHNFNLINKAISKILKAEQVIGSKIAKIYTENFLDIGALI